MALKAGDDKPTAAQSRWMGRIAGMACISCTLLMQEQTEPSNVHHIREGGQARNHWLVLPLCWSCHQGRNGVHGEKVYLAILKLNEWALFAHVLARLNP